MTNQASEVRKALITAVLSLRHAEIATRPSSAEDAERAFESAVQHISDFIRTEKLNLLAEVRVRVVGESEPEFNTPKPELGNMVRNRLREAQTDLLTKMEAEL